jgi:hypothetical protein
MFSDDDIMSMEHVMATYDGIPNAELAVVPGTSYPPWRRSGARAHQPETAAVRSARG